MSLRMLSVALFILEEALSVQKDNASALSSYLRRIIHLDELGQTFLARLVMRLQYKDGHKTYYPSRQTISFEIRLERRTTRDSSSRRIIRLVSVLILETHNQTNGKCLPNCSSRRIMRP